MASSPRMPLTPVTATLRPLTMSPESSNLDVSSTPLTNGRFEISKRFGDSGFDEDSIRRRDKAALIAYIAKLEAEIFDLQHNIGVLVLERKDSASKYEDSRLSTEKAEVKHLRDQAAISSVLAEARKREDNLKKLLGIEKECVANIEKALHEMRAESAEVKIAADIKMAEARSLVEDTQQKYAEAEEKLRAAESLRDEVRRSERAAGRKLQEVEGREDDLRRRITSFKSDCDAKVKEIMLERQSLAERQKVLSESQNKLLDSQALLNQREADILSKSQALKRLERELEDKKESIAAEMRVFAEQRSNLELNAICLSEREKVVVEKEVSLNKKEQELLISQEMLSSKENNKIQKVLADQEIALKRRRDEFDVELLAKQKLVDEDIEKKRRVWELRELDLNQREDSIIEKEQNLEVQSRVIANKSEDLAENMKNMQEREYHLNRSETQVELTKSLLQQEREEINKLKVELENSLISLKEEKKQISEEKMRFEVMKRETGELSVLETKLKEEIDLIRAQKQQLDSEAEKLKVEKAKFETEWEFIDVKREELCREEERIAVERVVIENFLKDQRDSLNLEKEALREKFKRDLESLNHDRETLMSESQHERSDWFSNFQKEQADMLLEIECRKRELEDSVNKQREDIQSYLREKERTFEEEKKRDLQYISSLKEDLIKEQERVAVALNKFEAEKLEIKVDREQRDKAWAELQNLIEELQVQRMKLKEQREMLHADREDIHSQIEQLKKLEDVKADSDRVLVSQIQKTCVDSTPQVLIRVSPIKQAHKLSSSEKSPGPPSWLRKCASLVFKHPPGEVKHMESSLDSTYEVAKLGSVEKELMRIDEKIRRQKEMQMVAPSAENAAHQPGRTGSGEAKVIHEVPSVDEEAAPSEVREHVHKSSDPFPLTSSARKRRIDNSSTPGTDMEHQNDASSNKKRRQEVVDAHDSSVKSKQSSGDGLHVVSLSSQSESTEKVVNSLAEVEKHSKIISEMVDTRITQTQVQQSAVDKSVLVENEAVTRIITEQTVIQQVHVVNFGEPKKPNEKASCLEDA
ncbi:nuclear matrix constituent protein 1b-like [Silene latifolia]|uniref:nuclear matrix constituent protein 1b-like n=1 Tax=Silene latifolia TaxID=37657 RepID=UPI003D77EC22